MNTRTLGPQRGHEQAAGQADRRALERAENEGLAEPLEQDRTRQDSSRPAPCSSDEHRSES